MADQVAQHLNLLTRKYSREGIYWALDVRQVVVETYGVRQDSLSDFSDDFGNRRRRRHRRRENEYAINIRYAPPPPPPTPAPPPAPATADTADADADAHTS